MAIGILRALRLVKQEDSTLIEASDLVAYPPDTYAYHELTLCLTLLPDRGCRFRSVDFVVDFERGARKSNWPRVLRMRPLSERSEKKVKAEMDDSAELGIKAPPPSSVSLKLKGGEKRTEEFQRVLEHLAAFGIGTRQAGWRFELTESRDIPISSPELSMLIAGPTDLRPGAHLRVTAEIDILGPMDRWLTWAFKHKAPQALEHDIKF
jgi:hypothetical protein